MSWGATSRRQRFWDFRAACNFIGGGTGSSLVWWASLALVAGLPYVPAALTGMSFVAAGLLMVWLEIGKPWRAFNLFFRPKTSWMTREGIVALPLFGMGVVSILLVANGLPATTSLAIPIALTAILGLIFLYCQLRILNSARGLPAWRDPRAMVLVGLSGLTEGLGVYLLLIAILGIATPVVSATLLALLGARALAWRNYVAALGRSDTPGSTIRALGAIRNVFLIAGHVVPAMLIVGAFWWPDVALTFSALAGVAATLAGWLFKVVLVTKAAYIPKSMIPNMPVRGRPGPRAGAQSANQSTRQRKPI